MRQNLIMILRRSDSHGGYNVETHTISDSSYMPQKIGMSSRIFWMTLSHWYLSGKQVEYSMCLGLWYKKHDPHKFLLQSVVALVAWQWRTEQIVETAECELEHFKLDVIKHKGTNPQGSNFL